MELWELKDYNKRDAQTIELLGLRWQSKGNDKWDTLTNQLLGFRWNMREYTSSGSYTCDTYCYVNKSKCVSTSKVSSRGFYIIFTIIQIFLTIFRNAATYLSASALSTGVASTKKIQEIFKKKVAWNHTCRNTQKEAFFCSKTSIYLPSVPFSSGNIWLLKKSVKLTSSLACVAPCWRL